MRKFHRGNVDENGNYRDKSRKSDGYLEGINNDLPFAAVVTAWHPKSQTIEVVRPIPNGNINYDSVVVYGNFFEAAGTIQGPKIATTLKDDGYTTYRDKDQVNPLSDDYVLNNHIEALVFPVSVGNTITYAAQSFRFLTADSPLLNNVKEGRKITRHDDGSYSLHDDDGNYQFTHPSGLNIRVGDSVDDIELDEPFPLHEKNVLDYVTGVIAEIKVPSAIGEIKLTLDGAGGVALAHPTGSVFEYDVAGLLEVTSSTSENLKTIINSFIAEVKKIIVANGTGPDVAALTLLQTDLALLLK